MSIVDFSGEEQPLQGDIRLDGREIDLVVGGGLVSFDETLRIDGSPLMTVGVLDVDRVLPRSKLFDHDGNGRLDRPVDLVVDRVAYRLGGVGKKGDVFTMRFEDRSVALLRNQSGPLKVRRGTLDHVGFVRRLCAEAGVEVVTASPGPIERTAKRKTTLKIRQDRERADRERRKGIADKADLEIKGEAADDEQLDVLHEALSEADRHDPPRRAELALVEAMIVETACRNIQGKGADAISFGPLQNIPGTAQGVDGTMTKAQAQDVAYVVRSALLPPGPTSRGGLIKLAKDHPGWTPGEIAAAAINGGGDPQYAAKCNAHRGEAQAIIDAFGGGDAVPSSTGTSTVSRLVVAELSRGTPEKSDENSWAAMQRIAEDYGYRCFAVANVIYYLSDEALMRSRIRMTLSERTPGVEWVDWEWDQRKAVNLTDVTCHALAWQAPPGSVVALDEEAGPAAGRWLVVEYRRSRFSTSANIQLARGSELLRPKIPTETETIGVGIARKLRGVTLDERWGGTQSIFEEFVTPFMARRGGLQPGSQKRATQGTSTGGVSDHWQGSVRAYAIDYPTLDGEGVARELAEAIGWETWQPNVYGSFTVTIDDQQFRFQILWGAEIEHGDHVHVGVKAL